MIMKTTCYKCGREIEGTKAVGVWPICPECEMVEVMKSIRPEVSSSSGHSHGGGGGLGLIDNQKLDDFLKGMMWRKIQYDYMPKWSTVVQDDGRRFNTGMLCLFFGSFGAHLFYMKRWVPVAVLLVMLAMISGGLSTFLLFPFFAVFSLIYFTMDDMTFRKKCLSKSAFNDYFKAQLCLYNLAKYGQKIPDFPPMSFANCIMTRKDIERCKPVLSNFMANDYFKKEMQCFKDFEDNHHISYQEGLLRKIMQEFPELTDECENAIQKIHMTDSFVEDWGDRIRY